MSKQKSYLLQKLFHTKHTLIHTLLIIFLGLGIFGIIQNTKAQLSPAGFSVINTQFPLINKNIGNYITTGNFGTIKLGASGIIDDFRRNRNGINTKLYDTGINLIYFNNFDTQESLEENFAPIADSIRDFPGSNFTGGIIGTGNNGWRYLYKTSFTGEGGSETIQTSGCYTSIPQGYNCYECEPSPGYCSLYPVIGEACYFQDADPSEQCFGDYICFSAGICEEGRDYSAGCNEITEFYCTGTELSIKGTQIINVFSGLTYNSGINLRTIGTEPITTYNFANIGKKYSHPGSGEINGVITGNIPVIQQRTSNLSGKIKIINVLSDDENDCGNGVIYKIYTGEISSTGVLTNSYNIKTHILPNLSGTTIERSGNIKTGDKIFFEIDNRGNNLCDGTRNWIQIYNITNNLLITGGPSLTESGKYGGALEFSGNQRYSLGNGVNQGSGITISARINTRDITKNQGIVTKKYSYGIVLKDGKIRVSPSTYWMRHDTNILINQNERTHITRTYDGSIMHVYKNGSENVRTYNVNGSLIGNNELAMIGEDEINERGRDGFIDEVRMYNTGLTSQQVQQLYESNLKITKGDEENSYREFAISKTGLADGTYNYTGTYDSSNKTGRIIVDISGPTIYTIGGRTNNESHNLDINISGRDANQIYGYQRRRYLDGQRTNRTNWSMTSGFSIPAKDEATTGIVEVNVKDSVGWITNRSGIIERFNVGPYLTGTTTITGYIEDELTFSVTAIDTGSDITYQWYLSGDGDFKIITGATGASYTTGRYYPFIEIKLRAEDSQGARSGLIFTGEWLAVTESINNLGNTGTGLNGLYTGKLAITGNKMIFSGAIGTCSITNTHTIYTGDTDPIKIGNDYCIIQSGGQQIILGRYGVNRYNTLFTLTGTKNSPYAINPISNQFIFEFQNTHLTGFKRAISGTNNTTTGTYNIFDQNLLGLYNFDKILLADSESDFMPIQSGKNRTYQRRPRGKTEYTDLQYNNITKQRIIGADEDEEPLLFIDNKLINPGDLYGDAVIGRTSPVNAKILVEYYLELYPNSNQNCTGNGINYVFKKNTSIIQTGEILELSTIESAIKTIDIKKSDSLFFEIKSKGDNTCDVVLYDIKIYQLPETNVASGSQGTNSGGNYIENGRYGGALEFFDNNRFVSIGTGVYAPQMSISLRAYKTSDNSPQTIIEKGGSYGLIISGNKLHIVDNYTLYNTQIEIPNYTWTHIGRSQDGQTAKVYINGKLQHNIPSLSNLVPNINSTQIGYLYPHGQRIGLLDEIYIYSGAISSGHFAALYEHNLNKIARDRWTWVSNTSGAINDGNFFFTGTSTSYNGSQRIQTGEFSRDFTPPEFSKRTWIMSGSQITGESITTGIIIFQNQSIVLSGAWLSGVGKAINTGSYEWDIDDNGSIDGTGNTIIIPFDGQYSRIIKRSVKDLAGNIGTQTGEIIWQNVIPPVFSGFIINGNTGNIITGNIEIQESNSATITRTGYDQNGLIQNGFEWTIRIPGTGDIVLTGQTGTITIPKWDEPVQGTIEVTAKNMYDFKTISTANLLRTNIGPELNDPKSEYTGLVEKPITFTITGFVDTGNNLEEFTYARYIGHNCNTGNTITGETNNTYTTTRYTSDEYLFSYQIFDKQLSGTCHNFTGIRESFEENDPTIIGNTGTGFNGGYTGQLEITGSMINSGTIGICSGDNNFTYYTGYTLPNPNTGIGNDYCIIQTGGNQIVLGWYGVNRNNTLFNLTGTTGNNVEYYVNHNGFNNTIYSIAIQSDDKIIIGGGFTGYQGSGANRIIRLHTNGSRDDSFIIGSGFDKTVSSIAIQSDGKIIIGGHFDNYKGVTANKIIRLNTDGSLDSSFNIGSGFNNYVNSIAIQPDGKILVGGNFNTYNGSTANRIIRLNSDGSRDNFFDIGSGFNHRTKPIAIQSDGKIIIGGRFSTYQGINSKGIVKLNIDGSRDSSFNIWFGFNSGLISYIYSIAIQPDGKIIIGGDFTTYNGSTANRIIRLNSDGSRDNSFDIGSGFDRGVLSIAIQPDNKIIVGGDFTGYQGTNSNKITRLDNNGSLDLSFNIGSGFNDIIRSIRTQFDGKIIVGGDFTGYQGTNSNKITRLNNNGSKDNTFEIKSYNIVEKNYYTLSSKTNPFITSIQNTYLTGFRRTISGTNNNKNETFNVFNKNLLGLYNFDEILLADSLEDFTPIQTGKNRSYLRRPLGGTDYTGLQYHPESKQRIISNDIQNFDGLFISKNKLNPGYGYGDAVLGRTSPVSANIKIELSLIDDNSTCGDGITYKVINNYTNTEIASGTYGTNTIYTTIKKNFDVYFRINSSGDNDCDTTNYRIKIYQRPETNIANNVGATPTFGINSGASYIQTGKFGGAIEFTENNKFINLGTGLHNTGAMSVSMRLYKTSDQANQTILIKTGSYGIAIFNNTLQVTNRTTQQRFDTQIQIPNNTWTHIGRSYNGSIINVYINGKLEKSQGLQGNIALSQNPTYIGYSPSNGQRNGIIDELYIYSGAISSGHFATLYEHNLNRTARDKRTWTSNTSGSINEGIFDFTGTVTSQNGATNFTGGTIRKDFNGPLFSGRSWEVNGTTKSTTGNTIEIQGKYSITLSGIRDDKFGLGINTGSYKRDIDDNGTIDATQETITIPYQNGIESRIIKATVEDKIGNISTITGEIKRLNANPPTFSGFLGTTGFESEQLIVSRTGILPDSNTKIDWTITLPSSTITHENTGTTITIPAQDEPTTANISVKISDEYGFEMTNESTIQWINTGPTITDTVTEYSGVVEKLLVFNAAGIDTGSQLSYQRYNTGGCPINQTIIGATGKTYSTRRDTPTTQNFSYQIFDSQGSGSCHNFTGIRDNQVLKPLVPIYTTGINLNGNNTIGIDITGTTIIHPGTKGICTISGEQTTYTANPQTIGNDYCIIQTGSSVNSRVVVWFNNININKTFFSITGSLFQQQRLLSPTSNPFTINILSNNLTGIIQTLSGTNNSNIISGNIYTGLLAMYNFDRIILTDSQTDFGPIQNYKGRNYQRRPRGTGNLTDLQYDPISQQRLVSRPVQEYDGMFIKSNTLNPGDDYGDIVLKRTSPFNANIEINLNLIDAIASCGDGIKYEIIKGTTNIHSGSYGNYTIPTTISKSESLYFKINSSGNNLCDTTNYRIQIYQLPETNISQNQTLSTNSGAQYITQGKKGGAFSFTNNNQLIRLGTGLVNASGMSIAFWVNPENTNGNQTIIQKGASYGIALSSGTIYVTNKSTQQRFNTEITIEADKRTHIGRSYDSLNMKLYKNGKEVREKYIGGSIGGSTNNTIIAYSTEHGQFRGKIDELYIYNYVVPQQIIGLLHQYNFNKIGLYNRSLTENKDAFTNGGYDGKFNYYITGSNNSTGLNMLIDFNGPIISNINGLTGRESQNLLITGILYDSGSQFSGYQRRTIINETATIRSQRNNSPNFTITIPAQIETSTGILEIKTRDVFGHELISTNNISWQNTGPIISNNQVYEYWAKIGSNITFVANAIDEGSNLTYQRYSGHDCTDILALETNSTLTTGSNTEETRIYSFKTFDNYQEPSLCVNLTGERTNEPSLQNLTVYLTGDGKGGIISGNRNSLSSWIGYSQTGKTIITNGQKGICSWTGNKTRIVYTRSKEYQGNDSCIIQLDNNEQILLAFVDIHTGFWSSRTQPFPEITLDKRFVNLYSKVYIPEITDFIINRGGENTQGSGLINKTITGQDNNVIRKYSFDRILITDSTEDFGKFKNEYSWNYFRDNGTSTGGFTFSPRIQSRIINEPLQDYEYIFISSGEMYPGATKYGKIVYERTSNINGSIDIESQINNKNPGYCTNTDGIIYTIKKSDSYGSSNIIYSRNLPDLTENSTTGTVIASGEKLYFIVDSKNNNQCDKISLNAKIYFNPIHDFSANGQTLQISGANYNSDGKYGGSYDFSTDQSFLNIGTINKGTGLTFSTRIKINGTSNQTILYKQGSYGLAIKDGSLKVTTDGGRWHNTNTDTTSKLTNGQRNHLLWTYDGTNMYVFVNGEQTRTNRIVGYYPTNSNATIIGRSTTNGQLNGSIDELHVRKKFITANEAKDIYNTHFRKLDGETWNFAFTQTGLADGIYTITGTINGDNIFTGKTIIDNNAPSIDFLGYTGNESENLNIVITGYDEGTSISGFTYRYKISNTNSWSNTINRTRQNSTGNEINIEAQNEPTIGIIEITIRDESNNKKTYTPTIERLNVAIITEPLFVTGHEGSTITFTASGYDTGGTTNTGYQRYIGEGCINKIVGANQKTFATGKNEPNTVTFSYTMFDAQGLTGICSTATGIWQNTQPIAKDLYVNASGDYNITFNATGSDPGNTVFSGAWFTGNSCTGSILSTGLTFTTSSTKSGAYEFSYYLRDAQGATGVNNVNTGRQCQIATGYRPYLNPIANDFIISQNTTNKLATGDRKSSSQVKDPEYNTSITATISSGSKGYCQITNNRISFQPIVNNIGTGFCELTLTDGNDRSTIIKAYALNIDTTAPTTTITTGNYQSFELIYNDTSIGTGYYKTLIGVRNVNSCGTSGYIPYISGTTIPIAYTPGTTDYRTICYYGQDIYGNRENIKTQLFTQPKDAIPFNVVFSSNPFMNNIFEATITTNKNSTGTLTGLDGIKILSLTAGTHTITGNFTENNGQKTAYISLQTQNTGEIFVRAHTFTIDQTAPSTPVIIEQIENSNYYTIKRNPSTDEVSGIKGYNYEISNQYTKVKEGFTDVTYLNILKSEVQYNSWISIKVQSQDKVNNVSQRSSPISITIPQQQPQQTTIDTEPNQFAFTKTTNAKRNTTYTSNEIVIGGLSNNTLIPIRLSTGNLFINDSKISNNSGLAKNGDIIYIQLYSSEQYNESTHAILVANGISATYTITTEGKGTKSSTTSFLEELRKLLEQVQKEDTNNTNTQTTTDTTIDTKRVSAPHIAPNGKTYSLYKTIDGRYSSHNFVTKRYFTSLSEMKTYIDKNNPR